MEIQGIMAFLPLLLLWRWTSPNSEVSLTHVGRKEGSLEWAFSLPRTPQRGTIQLDRSSTDVRQPPLDSSSLDHHGPRFHSQVQGRGFGIVATSYFVPLSVFTLMVSKTVVKSACPEAIISFSTLDNSHFFPLKYALTLPKISSELFLIKNLFSGNIFLLTVRTHLHRFTTASFTSPSTHCTFPGRPRPQPPG